MSLGTSPIYSLSIIDLTGHTVAIRTGAAYLVSMGRMSLMAP
jgi:hypothetical protein